MSAENWRRVCGGENPHVRCERWCESTQTTVVSPDPPKNCHSNAQFQEAASWELVRDRGAASLTEGQGWKLASASAQTWSPSPRKMIRTDRRSFSQKTLLNSQFCDLLTRFLSAHIRSFHIRDKKDKYRGPEKYNEQFVPKTETLNKPYPRNTQFETNRNKRKP